MSANSAFRMVGGGGGNLVKEENGEGGVNPQEGGGVRWGRFLPHLRW